MWSEPFSTPFFVCTSSEGPGDATHKHRHVCARADQMHTTYRIKWADPLLYKAAIFLWKVVVVLSFQFKTMVGGIKWKLIMDQRMSFGTYRTCVKLLIKHTWTSIKWARCLNCVLDLYLHLSLYVRTVKALAMLHTSAGTSLTKHAWPVTKWS